MGPQDWARLRGHFEALCELPQARQASALEALEEPPELVERLRQMLAADRDSALAEDVSGQAPSLHRAALASETGEPAATRIGERLGGWRIVAEAGSGGMGHVYRALRDDGRYQAEAAIKVVSRGMDAERFRHEREVLARLQHPGIARLLDAGECEDGRPYLVMEFVDGAPIDRHCEQRALPAAERIGLVLAAARAVAFAHARAVLHRDLKPDNMLVAADGQVKLLDFGVAKLLDEAPEASRATVARFFTPHYAAPEQLAGEAATTATDVFSLAVVLYELVAGCHPFAVREDGHALSWKLLTGEAVPLRRALARQPRPLRMAGSGLRDLEAVLDRALQRDPLRRYASMAAFADELEAVLEGRPVQALSMGPIGRLWRWSRRHRLAAASLALGLLGMGLGLAAAIWQANEARLQRDVALVEAERARRIADFLSGVLREPNPGQARATDMSARELLDRSRERMAEELADDPSVRIELMQVLAETYRSLGHYDVALDLLQQAIGISDGRSAALVSDLGWVQLHKGLHGDGAETLAEAAALATEEGDAPLLVRALLRRSTALINLHRYDEADAAVSRAIALLQSAAEPDPVTLIEAKALLGNVAYYQGDLARAGAVFREELALREAMPGGDPRLIALALNNLASVLYSSGDFAAAEAAYHRSAAMARERYGGDHGSVGMALRGVGISLRKQVRGEEALGYLREAADIQSAWSGDTHVFALRTSMDALELALLLGEPFGSEWPRLNAAVESLGDDSADGCRLRLLLALATDASHASALRPWVECLDRMQTHPAVRAHAMVALVLRLHAEAADDAALLGSTRELLAGLQPADPYLEQALAAVAP
jgi:eukaryotic-like serine/threonine-protein kinase